MALSSDPEVLRHLGAGPEMLCYGIEREAYLREVRPAGALALRAGEESCRPGQAAKTR